MVKPDKSGEPSSILELLGHELTIPRFPGIQAIKQHSQMTKINQAVHDVMAIENVATYPNSIIQQRKKGTIN